MHTLVNVLLLFSIGYVVSIYTWPKVKVWLNGAKAEADKLREKARELEKKIF